LPIELFCICPCLWTLFPESGIVFGPGTEEGLPSALQFSVGQKRHAVPPACCVGHQGVVNELGEDHRWLIYTAEILPAELAVHEEKFQGATKVAALGRVLRASLKSPISKKSGRTSSEEDLQEETLLLQLFKLNNFREIFVNATHPLGVT
jgi:hypothetical protein